MIVSQLNQWRVIKKALKKYCSTETINHLGSLNTDEVCFRNTLELDRLKRLRNLDDTFSWSLTREQLKEKFSENLSLGDIHFELCDKYKTSNYFSSIQVPFEQKEIP